MIQHHNPFMSYSCPRDIEVFKGSTARRAEKLFDTVIPNSITSGKDNRAKALSPPSWSLFLLLACFLVVLLSILLIIILLLLLLFIIIIMGSTPSKSHECCIIHPRAIRKGNFLEVVQGLYHHSHFILCHSRTIPHLDSFQEDTPGPPRGRRPQQFRIRPRDDGWIPHSRNIIWRKRRRSRRQGGRRVMGEESSFQEPRRSGPRRGGRWLRSSNYG